MIKCYRGCKIRAAAHLQRSSIPSIGSFLFRKQIFRCNGTQHKQEVVLINSEYSIVGVTIEAGLRFVFLNEFCKHSRSLALDGYCRRLIWVLVRRRREMRGRNRESDARCERRCHHIRKDNPNHINGGSGAVERHSHTWLYKNGNNLIYHLHCYCCHYQVFDKL